MNSKQLLAKASDLWAACVTGTVKANLELGKVLHEYILTAMGERNALKIDEARGWEYSRTELIVTIAETLDVTTNWANDIIRTSMAALLLSPSEEFGHLSWSLLRYFGPYVRRDCPGNQSGKRGDFLLHETWIPSSDFESGKVIFDRALAESLSQKEVRRLLRKSPTQNNRRLFSRSRRKKQEDHEPMGFKIQNAIAKCSAKDAAEIIYQWTLESREPELLANKLVAMFTDKCFKIEVKNRNRKNAAA